MENHMKLLVSFTLSSALLVSACSGSPQDNADVQAPAAAPPATSVHNYRCESGETIAATYPSAESATVQYKGSNHKMQIAVSGSGARYVGGGLEWWTKGSGPGSEGTLFLHGADGTSGEIIEFCKES